MFPSHTMDLPLPFKTMILRLLLSALLCLPALAEPQPLLPDQVLVVYNASVPQSQELAEFYALNRHIPKANLIGLEVTEKATIDRKTYEDTIRKPLLGAFAKNNWWKIGKNAEGQEVPLETRIRCLVLIKGMPLRISRAPMPAGEDANTRQFNQQNEASLDSELSLMGVADYPIGGIVPNPCFNQEVSAATNPANFMLMVGRLDAHTYDHCTRIILDSLDVEKEGLWGTTYLDLCLKPSYKMGDDWIDAIAKASINSATPTIVDRMSNTYVTNYPMNYAAVYFGWYSHNRDGPFLNPEMRFQKGAIAVHLHSFSAVQMLDPTKNWSAALIDRGAAATLGNVYEPYLGLSHQFHIFYDRLLKGYSLVEAGYMSINVLSWQNVVIGDPLYTPFKTKTVSLENMESDRDFKLIRYAQTKFPDPKERLTELLKAAERSKNGIVYEMIGSHTLEAGNYDQAIQGFNRAKQIFTHPSDKLRQDLHLVELERRRKNNAAAITILKTAKATYKDIPGTKAIDGLLTILDPPAPPATKSK